MNLRVHVAPAVHTQHLLLGKTVGRTIDGGSQGMLHMVHVVLDVHLLRYEIGEFFLFLRKSRTLDSRRVARDIEGSSGSRGMRYVSDGARNRANASGAEAGEESSTVVGCGGSGHFDASSEVQKTGRYQLRVQREARRRLRNSEVNIQLSTGHYESVCDNARQNIEMYRASVN